MTTWEASHAGVDNVVQKVNLSHGTWSSPAYFNNMIYEHASGDVLKAFGLANGVLSSAPIAQGSASHPFPGATPSISSNGNANGIVWDIQYDASHAMLRAYNAVPNGTSLTELFNSNQNTSRDQLSAGVKFVTPMIADGHVYVASGQLGADYNRDGKVDAADYTVWRDTQGRTVSPSSSGADGSGNGTVDSADFNQWKAHFGETGVLSVFGLLSPPITAPNAHRRISWRRCLPHSRSSSLGPTPRTTSSGSKSSVRPTACNYTQIDVASANATSYIDTTVVPGTTYSYRVRAANDAGDF